MAHFDAITVHVCSMLSSMAFGATFLVLWLMRGRSVFYLLCGAASLTYAATIAGHTLPGRGIAFSTVLFASLGLYNGYILAAVRAFEGKRVLDGWVVALPVLSGATFAVVASLSGQVETGRIATSAVLGLSTLGVGLVLLRTEGSRAPRSRRLLAMIQLAYVPAYTVSVGLDLSIGTSVDWLSFVPLMSDQLLLGVLNIALLAMPGERAEAALSEAALRDPLTGAWNRAGLAGIEASLRAPATVILFDVDHFKAINDRFGHAAGDAVLVSLSDGARAALPADAHLARLGGDEFAAVIPNLSDVSKARAIAEGLRAIRTVQPGCTISLGFSPSEPGDAGLAKAMSRADAMLYRAKGSGRNCVAA